MRVRHAFSQIARVVRLSGNSKASTSRFAQDLPMMCPRYAQDMPKVWGFEVTKWDRMSPGSMHPLGQYVAREVRDAVGQFVAGKKCLLTL